MLALIMAGGRGARLKALYPETPKLLVPILKRPFLEWQLDWLTAGGITRVHIAGGLLGDQISDYIKHNQRPGLNTTFSREPSPFGTGGALKFVENILKTDPFFSINGDTLLPSLNFQAMMQSGMDGKSVSMAITRIESAGRYGTVVTGKNNTITAFLEKAVNTAGWVNGGVSLIQKSLLAKIDAGKQISLETEILPTLANEGRVKAFKTQPPLLDMGTPEGIATMEKYLLNLHNECKTG